MGEMTFPKEEYTNWLSSAKGPALKTRIQVVLYRLNVLYLRIYMDMHICMQQLVEKRPFEAEYGGIYERVCRKAREGKCVVIICNLKNYPSIYIYIYIYLKGVSCPLCYPLPLPSSLSPSYSPSLSPFLPLSLLPGCHDICSSACTHSCQQEVLPSPTPGLYAIMD